MKYGWKDMMAMVIIALGLLFTGIYMGKNMTAEPEVKRVTEIKWLPGEPYEVEVPGETIIKYLTKEKEVSVPEYITIPADTASIIADYLLRREYEFDFSNDTIGTYKAYIDVQANQVISANSYIRPLTRVEETTITLQAKRKTQGYAQIGSSLNANALKFSGGVDLRNRVMVGGSAIRLGNEWGYTIDAGIKF